MPPLEQGYDGFGTPPAGVQVPTTLAGGFPRALAQAMMRRRRPPVLGVPDAGGPGLQPELVPGALPADRDAQLDWLRRMLTAAGIAPSPGVTFGG